MLGNVRPGEYIWVVNDYSSDIESCLFIAKTNGFVIATPLINDMDDITEILEYHAYETQENYDTDLFVFYEENCFGSRDEAESAV